MAGSFWLTVQMTSSIGTGQVETNWQADRQGFVNMYIYHHHHRPVGTISTTTAMLCWLLSGNKGMVVDHSVAPRCSFVMQIRRKLTEFLGKRFSPTLSCRCPCCVHKAGIIILFIFYFGEGERWERECEWEMKVVPNKFSLSGSRIWSRRQYWMMKPDGDEDKIKGRGSGSCIFVLCKISVIIIWADAGGASLGFDSNRAY